MSYTKNYYGILGLAPPGSRSASTAIQKSSPTSADLRQAYRSALLAAHPDKQGSTTAGVSAGSVSTPPIAAVEENARGCRTPSVDDVREAYSVLSQPDEKRKYDAFILRNTWILTSSAGSDSTPDNARAAVDRDFLLGLEVLDLSDFEPVPQDEDQDRDQRDLSRGDGGQEEVWARGCRCGEEEGFVIAEGDLLGAEAAGETEVLVGCVGCSLWVRVGFAVEEGEGDEG